MRKKINCLSKTKTKQKQNKTKENGKHPTDKTKQKNKFQGWKTRLRQIKKSTNKKVNKYDQNFEV